MTDTWTCDFCSTTHASAAAYESCPCPGRLGFNAGRSVPYSTREGELAAAEARERGMAFMVNGKHVNADRVFILSVPDTIGPISDMRQAKVEAQAALTDLHQANGLLSDNRKLESDSVNMTGQHLRQIMDVLGMEKIPAHDDTYLGMHSYITMLDIEAKCRELMSEMCALIKANNDLREIVHGPAAATRFPLAPFFELMNQELAANDHKGDRTHWLSMSRDQAIIDVYHHLAKFARAVQCGTLPHIREHAADVACSAMIVADVCHAFDAPITAVPTSCKFAAGGAPCSHHCGDPVCLRGS